MIEQCFRLFRTGYHKNKYYPTVDQLDVHNKQCLGRGYKENYTVRSYRNHSFTSIFIAHPLSLI